VNVMRHLGMIEDAKFESHIANSETNSKAKPKKTARSAVATTVLTKFDWLYTKSTGVWYPKVAQGRCRERRRTDRHGRRFVWRHSGRSCFACERRGTFSDDQSIRAREWIINGNRCGLTSDNQGRNGSAAAAMFRRNKATVALQRAPAVDKMAI